MAHAEVITWRVHLAAQRPLQAIAALIVIMFALFAVSALGGGLAILLLAAVVLFGAIADFLLPVTYTLDEQGAHVRQLFNHRFLPWTRVRRVYLSPNGIKLSPLPIHSWVESYRGVVLRTPNRGETWAIVQAWLENAGVVSDIIEEA